MAIHQLEMDDISSTCQDAMFSDSSVTCGTCFYVVTFTQFSSDFHSIVCPRSEMWFFSHNTLTWPLQLAFVQHLLLVVFTAFVTSFHTAVHIFYFALVVSLEESRKQWSDVCLSRVCWSVPSSFSKFKLVVVTCVTHEGGITRANAPTCIWAFLPDADNLFILPSCLDWLQPSVNFPCSFCHLLLFICVIYWSC